MDSTEAVGWGWTMSASPKLPAKRSWTRRVLSLGFWSVSLALIVGFLGFLGFVYSLNRFERAPETRADGIVALTGGAQRIGEAIDLLAQGYAKRLLISGVNEKTSREQISSLNPGQRRLFDCCVDLDYRARNTIGNAIATRRWIADNGFRSLIVVTSNYHMPRTLLELDHALPQVRKVPYAVVASSADLQGWWRSPTTLKLLAYEYAKFVAMWARTRVEADPERSRVARIVGLAKPIKLVVQPLTR
jgi:uncharacterized SAM-binding protein YcdF (DUF218 family)